MHSAGKYVGSEGCGAKFSFLSTVAKFGSSTGPGSGCALDLMACLTPQSREILVYVVIMLTVMLAAQTEHKWKLEGIEAAAADTLRTRLGAPPRLK